MARTRLHTLLAGAVLGLALLSPAHAWLGALGKIGSAAGKGAASTAGKGAAAGAGAVAVAGAEAVQGANAAAKAGTAAATADDVSRASGLGKAVPDDIAAMLHTPGKTLADVPDVGARSWLGTPRSKLGPADADLMVRDYVALLEGKPAQGPTASRQAAAPAKAVLPAAKAPAEIPWYAAELALRAAHLGHKGAQSELDRLCRSNRPPAGDTCRAHPITARKT